MPTTEQQRRAIAYLVRSYRESIYGGNQFDEPGIMAALVKVRHLDTGIVTMAAMRCAADPSIKTPGMIGDPSSSVYAEKVGPERARRHPKREESCHTCGGEFSATCCDNPTQRPTPSAAYAAHAANARTQLHARTPTHQETGDTQ